MFYKMAEADEVDGIEDTVDAWIENLWPVLKEVVSETQVHSVPSPIGRSQPAHTFSRTTLDFQGGELAQF